MPPESSLQINVPTITHQTIDGEVVAIHFTTGNYYSMRGAAAQTWAMLEQGISREGLLQQSSPDNRDNVAEFLNLLQSEELLVPSEQSVNSEITGIISEKPVLEKFDDMQQLLLADPIHEADMSAGWPNLKSDT